MSKKHRSEKFRVASTEQNCRYPAAGRSIVTTTDAKRLKALLAAYPPVLGHNEDISRLSESWVRFRDWADAWRRAHERNPEYRPQENDCLDDYLAGAMEFCFGKLHWTPDVYWHLTPRSMNAR